MPVTKALHGDAEEMRPLTQSSSGLDSDPHRGSLDSVTSLDSVSTTSLVLESLRDGRSTRNGSASLTSNGHASFSHDKRRYGDHLTELDEEKDDDLREEVAFADMPSRPAERKYRRLLWIAVAMLTASWLVALVLFLTTGSYKHASSKPHDPTATVSRGSGKQLTRAQIQSGEWRPEVHEISWIDGPSGEDGLLLEKGVPENKAYLVVEDVRSKSGRRSTTKHETRVLMKEDTFRFGDEELVRPVQVWPSRDLKKVLVLSDKESNWRHSFYGKYWIFDTGKQEAEPLDKDNPHARIQLASWSPDSTAVVFTRDKNLFIRDIASQEVKQITKDGGPQLFYGVPDWVYEEEVFSGNSATWWAEDGKYIAFLRTEESRVPEFPVQYFLSRPSGKRPKPDLENYPDVRRIKYPKAGAPNPIVTLQFYDVEREETFSVDIENEFPDEDRLITEVIWAGSSGKVLVKETNRVSNELSVVLIDVKQRKGKPVRHVDVGALDGGWFEVTKKTTYIPADPKNGRPDDGYIDTIIHEGYDHLAYFSPLDNSEPKVLTSGSWEVVSAPSAVDLKQNVVYFVATRESPIQRHVYSVKLDGTDLQSVTKTDKEGYYDMSFSKGAGYALVSYNGPEVPWQKVISTPNNKDVYSHTIEQNEALADLAAKHEMPIEIFSTVEIDGFTLHVHERRPPHFNAKKKYPVLFHLYGGPGSQTVNKKWNVDFQSYVAANLGYIVVTVDGRGTGYIGRKARCIIRGDLGRYEARDQIETAKIWAAKSYVDSERIAIWGWSYGGFLTLKTLEADAGQTFKYGMAVAPVTDWRFYDSIYTERYMGTPQENEAGYDSSAITNMTRLASNVRFLVMHGASDDNVHLQNTLTLLDKLDVHGVENYDVHFFPDSDHSIFFHNANRMVYDRLRDWLINAFNGEWIRAAHPRPKNAVEAAARAR
ncbi:MAG: hypothetical protein M1825_002350 [Sarcosagium campestre]|nr:MAG: hypothetical protein M1825_002350 [Sarcosagium campestre]